MNEREKQTVFLKRLLQREVSAQQQELQHRIAGAERDEACVRTALHLVAITGLLSLCGLCYEAIFVEDFFANPTHVVTRLFGYLGLGSVICWVMFLGYWLWHRALTNRLYEEGRRLLIAQDEPSPAVMVLPDFASPPSPTALKQDSDALPQSVPLGKAA